MSGSGVLSASRCPVGTFLVDDALLERSHRRCLDVYGLYPDVMRPILRLQDAEIEMRSQAFMDRIGGGRRYLGSLANKVAKTGGRLLVSDASRVVLSLSGVQSETDEFARNGVVAGSCWDERIAGTNGIQMASVLSRGVTLRGQDHFYTGLRQFSCTSVPVFDEDNSFLGALTVAALDKRQPDSFAPTHKLLHGAAGRVQMMMFAQAYKDSIILALHLTDTRGEAAQTNALVAVDESGAVVAATQEAARLSEIESPRALIGKRPQDLWGISLTEILSSHGRQVRRRTTNATAMTIEIFQPIRRRLQGSRRVATHARRPKPVSSAPALTDISNAGPKLTCLRQLADETVDLFADAVPLVLEGEGGTGKTSLVEILHKRCGGAYVVIDCSQLRDDQTCQADLNAIFTDAFNEDVENGVERTLVLDHLETAPMRVQAWIVLVLETLERRGIFKGTNTRQGAKTRLVSLFSKSCDALVTGGKFRSDLLYQLQGTRLNLPPLREKSDRLQVLTELAREIAGGPVTFSSETVTLLQRYAFPGNLREARGILHHAVVRANGVKITLDHIPWYLSAPRQHKASAPDKSEPETIAAALSATGWNVSKAARRLGVSRATINRKIKAHGLIRPHGTAGTTQARTPDTGIKLSQ